MAGLFPASPWLINRVGNCQYGDQVGSLPKPAAPLARFASTGWLPAIQDSNLCWAPRLGVHLSRRVASWHFTG